MYKKDSIADISDKENSYPYNRMHNNISETAISESIPVANQRSVFNFAGKNVLVVDDVSFNLSLIELFFRSTGASIIFAKNGKEAVDCCLSHPEIDIVLMDIQMPVMNGFDATREIQKIKPEMPVIAITAFVHSDDKQRCFEAGCADYLPKPCSREDLLTAVRKLLQK
jgi:two-component system, cell cycle response regulator DivK